MLPVAGTETRASALGGHRKTAILDTFALLGGKEAWKIGSHSTETAATETYGWSADARHGWSTLLGTGDELNFYIFEARKMARFLYKSWHKVLAWIVVFISLLTWLASYISTEYDVDPCVPAADRITLCLANCNDPRAGNVYAPVADSSSNSTVVLRIPGDSGMITKTEPAYYEIGCEARGREAAYVDLIATVFGVGGVGRPSFGSLPYARVFISVLAWLVRWMILVLVIDRLCWAHARTLHLQRRFLRSLGRKLIECHAWIVIARLSTLNLLMMAAGASGPALLHFYYVQDEWFAGASAQVSYVVVAESGYVHNTGWRRDWEFVLPRLCLASLAQWIGAGVFAVGLRRQSAVRSGTIPRTWTWSRQIRKDDRLKQVVAALSGKVPLRLMLAILCDYHAIAPHEWEDGELVVDQSMSMQSPKRSSAPAPPLSPAPPGSLLATAPSRMLTEPPMTQEEKVQQEMRLQRKRAVLARFAQQDQRLWPPQRGDPLPHYAKMLDRTPGKRLDDAADK
jgi:hypothetical protein